MHTINMYLVIEYHIEILFAIVISRVACYYTYEGRLQQQQGLVRFVNLANRTKDERVSRAVNVCCWILSNFKNVTRTE